MEEHPIEGLMLTAMDSIRDMIDVNTIIGEPMQIQSDINIIPISKVSFGFATGGSELPTSKPSTPFGGGSGGGVTIQPLAFLVISNGNVKLLQMQTADNTADRIVNMMPGMVDKVSGIISDYKAKRPLKNLPFKIIFTHPAE